MPLQKVISKVWIAPGCIVCDSCENDCPEVFDVQEETCVIRPPAMSAEFLKPLSASIVVAAEGCPVDVIKFDYTEMEVADAPVAAPAAGGEGVIVAAKAAAPKKEAPLAPPDPKWQALLSTSNISPSLSAGLGTTIKKSSEVLQAEEMIRSVDLPADAPADQRAALLAAGGAYVPQPSLADRIRRKAADAGKSTRREFNFVLAGAWGLMAATVGMSLAMFQDFFGLRVLKEPKKLWRVGRPEDFAIPGTVYEQYKRTPDGSAGFWLVNLAPDEEKLVALSTICTHLGCIPDWLQGDRKFKCPCHGSGYYVTGVNFEGPTPRPLERYKIQKDAEGYVVVDMTKVFREELGEWENPESFMGLI